MGVGVKLEVSGTVIHRDGLPPVLAVSSMLDGHVVQAAVIDAAYSEEYIGRALAASVQPGAPSVQSPEQPRT